MNALRRLAREPFAHFLLLGAMLFALHAVFGARDERRIAVTASDVARLRAAAVKQWGREPDERQFDALVQAHVREEVLVREAIAAGLDRDDTIVRRRLAQKMEFLAQESVRSPSESELRAHFERNAARYAQPATFQLTLVQVPEGRASMLPPRLEGQTRDSLARDFGAGFADAVSRLAVGAWSEPLVSALGVHRVRVDARAAARIPEFDAVRARVAHDLVNERIAQARDTSYRRARARYLVKVDRDAGPPAPSQPVPQLALAKP